MYHQTPLLSFSFHIKMADGFFFSTFTNRFPHGFPDTDPPFLPSPENPAHSPPASTASPPRNAKGNVLGKPDEQRSGRLLLTGQIQTDAPMRSVPYHQISFHLSCNFLHRRNLNHSLHFPLSFQVDKQHLPIRKYCTRCFVFLSFQSNSSLCPKSIFLVGKSSLSFCTFHPTHLHFPFFLTTE